MFSFIKRRLSQGAADSSAQVAQLVEQGTENPCVGGSIPPLGTTFCSPATEILPHFTLKVYTMWQLLCGAQIP
jgi:hypothetical protein